MGALKALVGGVWIPIGTAGADGAAGPAGPVGPAGPAPAGTGYVTVTNGVLNAPSATIPASVVIGADEVSIQASDPGAAYELWYDTDEPVIDPTPPTGNVVGPATSTDRAIARYSGATGKILLDSSVTISDAGVLTAAAGLGTTPLDATKLTGTVADARLSTNVALLNAANVFTANQSITKLRAELQLQHTGSTTKARVMAHSTDAMVLTQNVSYDGTNWNADDTAKAGIVVGINSGGFGVYFTTAGANPRPLTTRFTITPNGVASFNGHVALADSTAIWVTDTSVQANLRMFVDSAGIILRQGTGAVQIQNSAGGWLWSVNADGREYPSQGIDFQYTAAHASLSCLDAYQEVMWTPTFTASGGGAPVYASQHGLAVKIGRFIYFGGRISLSSLGTLAGTNVTINGLPWVSNTALWGGAMNYGYMAGWNGAITGGINGYIAPGASYVQLTFPTAGGISLMPVAYLGGASDIIFAGHYYGNV